MKMRWEAYVGTVIIALLFVAMNVTSVAAEARAQTVERALWPFKIDSEHRPGAYWWWPGSAVTKENIDYNLERFQEGGFGLVHIVPIYGARGAEKRYLPYLSPQWMKMLDHAVRKARTLGLSIDMTTGTGWCFGGPNLPESAADARARYDKKTNTVKLPPCRNVKRPAPGGEGRMINPFSPAAMELYLQRFTKAFDAAKPAVPRAQYHDSFEYVGNWCAELLPEFKKRRGYDLRKHLPSFFNDKAPGDADVRARIKCDYRQTLAELHVETIALWTKWADERGMITRDQAHGAPANLLDVYAASDIPETEMFGAPEFAVPGFRRDPKMVRAGDSDPRICMLASSAAHVAHAPGRQLVSSESCTWLREHWRGSLAQVKLALDLFHLAGVNQILFHGSCFSPKDASWPGWFFYASTKMDWRNAIWRDVRYLSDYIARSQSVLQAGQPANDVLLYWPIYDLWMNPKGMTMPLTVHHHDWMARQSIGYAADELMKKGFAFDFISDQMIENLKMEKGTLVAPGGNYRAILVPACKYMPETTLKRLTDLAATGARVVFQKALPADVPGLQELDKRRAQFKAARVRLEKSKVIIADEVTAGLTKAGVVRETMVDAGLRFIRRREGETYWYFVANHTAKDFDGWIALAVPHESVTLFDPMTGNSGRLARRGKRVGQTSPSAGYADEDVRATLAPQASRPKKAVGDQPGKADVQVYLQIAAGETLILRATEKVVKAGPWTYLKPSGAPVPLNGEWSIEFIDGAPKIPAAYKTKDLTSWTDAPDAKAQAFAGTARYTLRFPKPEGAGDDWVLDLGDVRESARVKLNGKDAGALIALPFRMRVGTFLKPDENTLEIEVTNLSANRIRDLDRRKVNWKIMKDINIVNVHYKKFEPAKWPLAESGLLGPVRLIPSTRFTPAP